MVISTAPIIHTTYLQHTVGKVSITIQSGGPNQSTMVSWFFSFINVVVLRMVAALQNGHYVGTSNALHNSISNILKYLHIGI